MSKKIIKTNKKLDGESQHTDKMHALMTMSIFENSTKKKQPTKPTKSKKLIIDNDNDSQEEIIQKLVMTIQNMQIEFENYKEYVEGTFCTNTVQNRQNDTLEKKINDLSIELEETRNLIDD